VVFFEHFSADIPGRFPPAVTKQMPGGKTQTVVEPVGSGSDIQSIFFDMWRQDLPDAELQNVPDDMVTASASGLDPDITVENAEYQLNRVASKWAADLKCDPARLRTEIDRIIQADAYAPMGGLFGRESGQRSPDEPGIAPPFRGLPGVEARKAFGEFAPLADQSIL